ncbi:MAG TPA: hypothetical protein VFE32_13100 [Puia sp.]|jgi:hypothetical protein|nr:hypothetical protein [Puia sp.]
MIQLLSTRYRRRVALTLYCSFYFQVLATLAAVPGGRPGGGRDGYAGYPATKGRSGVGLELGLPGGGEADRGGQPGDREGRRGAREVKQEDREGQRGDRNGLRHGRKAAAPFRQAAIGGPNTPEAGSFKTVNADNLVNLFTGDFSYGIPLLDVGGYPVNIFYNGGITMEQEASWVGLGWNINPGSVSRSMRGVPDDFDGSDTLVQVMNVKPNKTWSGMIGADGELLGVKEPDVNLSLGFSYNNYLGPELDIGAGVSVTYPLIHDVEDNDRAPEDSVQGLNLGFGVNAKLSSRSGLTLIPSLNANMHLIHLLTDAGVGLSTSINSRTGIQNLNITSQVKQSAYLTSLPKDQNDYKAGVGVGISQTTITFARPSYVPTLRMPMLYSSYSGQVEVGAGMWGVRGSAVAQGSYSESQVAETVIYKPMVGYLYLDKANGRTDPVMDFNRVNDGPVTPNTPIISVPQYDYDIFTIQGEGTGGSIRAYRNDLGFMRDHLTTSRNKDFSLGFDIAPGGHYGGNFNQVSTSTTSGSWTDGNNTLYQSMVFGANAPNPGGFEHVYFRNPGEVTVTNDTLIDKIGRDNVVRFLVDGSAVAPMLESKLEQFSKTTGEPVGVLPVANANARDTTGRDKRTQIITMLSAADASRVGLDTSLRSYNNTLGSGNQLSYTSIPRVGGYRKAHHISEVTVLEANGMRYVYGLPVYNTVQQDFTLSVKETPSDDTSNLVVYAAGEASAGSSNQNINTNTGIDGYYSMQQTPAYASSFLITGLLSPDYVDRTGDGITEDDLGTAVKFDYAKSGGLHQWRTPRAAGGSGSTAHFNVGYKSEARDNKGSFSYGQREAWYLHAIESKSLIAIFSTSSRNDAKGVNGALDATTNSAENVNLKLDSISLYTKADIRAHGLPGAVPIKTVHFDYTYALCKRTPDNGTSGQGKLTLRDIYFTFNGQSRISKDMYVFNYGDTTTRYDNANYAPNAADKWGTYKPVLDSLEHAVNPQGLNNADYPYTSMTKGVDDQYAGEWSLKKILLPSGGQIEVTYESDDYAYVQNRRACNMYQIYGLGNNPSYSNSSLLYRSYGGQDQNYVYVELPTPLLSKNPGTARQEIFDKYLQTLNQLAFKLNVAMPKGIETLTTYAGYTDYGLCPNDTNGTMIYIKLATINGHGELANASVQFLINNLPGEAFPGYDLSDDTGLQDFFELIGTALGSLYTGWKNAVTEMRSAGKASTVSLSTSFVRLCSPTYCKYGGGHRVKRIVLKDNWDKMAGEYLSTYGQDYDYTTTQDIDGVPTTISSGVASYEPGIGSEENPFREIVQFEDKLPLASAQYGAIEMPVTEAFYGAPVVGYSQVTVRSIHRTGTHGDSAVRSAIGRQVTQYYTAKDFPVFSTYTPMNTIDYHHAPAFNFFHKETIDQRTTSQGFLVVTNDMHGKLRSQTVYSEGDPNTPLSYTIHTYKNTGGNGLNDLVPFVRNDQGGAISDGNIGVDMELMTSVREYDAQSHGMDDQANVDVFTFAPIPIFAVLLYPLSSLVQNTYKEVNTTKLINYHAIEDSVIVNDKGSVVSTKTMLYDAQTGSPVVTRTRNEFNDPIYNITYPAYWAYSGMGPAYSNIGMMFRGVGFENGRIVSGVSDQSVFESGDEVYITNYSGAKVGCPDPSLYTTKLWVYDTTKNSNSLTMHASERVLMFIDSAGRPFSGGGVDFTIVRSGHRNDLGQTVGTVTAMANPIHAGSGSLKLVVNDSDNVVSAGASEFKEKWQVDPDVIPTTAFVLVSCVYVEEPSCTGNLPPHINPYVKGLLGNFKPYRNYVYYGARSETDPLADTKIRHNGYIPGFGSYWGFDSYNNLVPANSNPNWLWNTEVTKINSKGQELETHDALNRYTSAQYGYAKNFPVAVTQNAASGQSFYAGFEDNSYDETLNGAIPDTCPNAKYLNLTGLTILKTDTGTVKAHTGRYALKVAAHDSATIPIPVGLSDSVNYTMEFGDSVANTLTTVGINSSFTPSYPNSFYYNAPDAFKSASGVSVTVDEYIASGNGHSVTGNWDGYIKIQTQGPYNFSVSAESNYNLSGQSISPAASLQIYDVNNTLIDEHSASVDVALTGSQTATTTYTVTLCPGIYHLKGSESDTYGGSGALSDSHDGFTYSCSNCGCNIFQSLATSSCTVTTPIAVNASMLNTVFSLQPGQQMQFSGWVRQDCSTPCFLTNYTNPTIKLEFQTNTGGSSVSVRPSGAIIEGWQRVDLMFTVPSGATSSSLVLGSDSASNVYFDDLRIHPFNADMKTYVYDPQTLRLMAELDENNYATIYNYDEEGQLIRVKKETVQGIKTIKETRTSKQKSITNVQ